MTQEEREHILHVFAQRESRKGRRDYALLALMYVGGLRESEVCQLTVADVDLAAGSLYVRNGKGAKDRRVPITPRLVQILRLWIDQLSAPEPDVEPGLCSEAVDLGAMSVRL